MEFLKCTDTEKIKVPEIYCPACNRVYAIYKIKHTCNELAKCDAKHIRSEERYIDVEIADNVFDYQRRCLCDSCTRKQARATRQRSTTCPECEYVGYYVHVDDTKRCPACIANEVNTVANVDDKKIPLEAADVSNTEQIPQAQLIPMTLYITSEVPMGTGRMEPGQFIQILGVTEESITTPVWFVFRFEHNNPETSECMEALSNDLRILATKHTCHWNETHSLKFQWLKYTYHLHTDEKRYPLC